MNGYAVARQAIDADLAAEMVAHVEWLMERHPGVRPEQLHHHMLVDDPFLHRLAGDDRLLDLVAPFLGSDLALFAAHYIAKPPRTGHAVHWHQDGHYWPLEPMEVMTLWVAGTDSTAANGCMRVLPGTQDSELLGGDDLVALDAERFVLGSGIHPDRIDERDAVDLELAPGDVSIHNPQIVHGSNANASDHWRIGLTLRYIPTSTLVKNPGHRCVLLRGRAEPSVANSYAARARFVAGEHMPFAGCESWT